MSGSAAEVCVRCTRDESNYLDPDRRLSVSRLCGHALCAGCLSQAFAAYGHARGLGAAHRGHTSVRCPAPGCDRTLTASDFAGRRPEEEAAAREREVRRKLGRVFNAGERDFASSRAYNDYLEMVESHVAALVTGEGAEAAESAIKAYVAANQSAIAYNSARQDATAREAAERLAQEAAAREAAAHEAAMGGAARRAAAARARRGLLDVLLGEREAVPPAERVRLKARLLELRARMRQGQGTGFGAPPPPMPAAHYSSPCPAVPLPKVTRRVGALAAASAAAGGPAGAASATATCAPPVDRLPSARWEAEELAEQLQVLPKR